MKKKVVVFYVLSLAEVELAEEECINVCGDIHGQYIDLENIFFLKVTIYNIRYIYCV